MAAVPRTASGRRRGVRRREALGLEQRRQEAKRSSQLQQETADLMKRTEGLRGFFDVAEKSISRLETRLNSLWNMRDELKAEVARAQEALRITDEERTRRSTAQAERFEVFVRSMSEIEPAICRMPCWLPTRPWMA